MHPFGDRPKEAVWCPERAASGPQLELPPGTYKFSLKMSGKAAASDQIVVAADETWGLLIGPGGVSIFK